MEVWCITAAIGFLSCQEENFEVDSYTEKFNVGVNFQKYSNR